MNTYSEAQLDAKIDAFMARKLRKYPDLSDRRFTAIAPRQQAQEKKRSHSIALLRLSTQY